MTAEPANIIIDLDSIEQPKGIEVQNYIHKKELNHVLDLLEEAADEARKYIDPNGHSDKRYDSLFKREYYHNSIAILGGRGSGKTTFLDSLEIALDKKHNGTKGQAESKRIMKLKNIDPTMMDQSDMFIITVFMALKEEVQKRVDHYIRKGFERFETSNDFERFEEAERDFTLKLKMLLRGDNQHVWSDHDEELLLQEISEYTRKGISLNRTFAKVVFYAARILDVHLFVLPIDDAEADLDRVKEVFETVRKYLNSPFLVPVLTCDLELARYGLLNSYTHSFEALLRQNDLRNESLEKLEDLADKSLAKILSPSRRVYLNTLKEMIFGSIKKSDGVITIHHQGTSEHVITCFSRFIETFFNINHRNVEYNLNRGFIKGFQQLLPDNNRMFVVVMKIIKKSLARLNKDLTNLESAITEMVKNIEATLIGEIEIYDDKSFLLEDGGEQKYLLLQIKKHFINNLQLITSEGNNSFGILSALFLHTKYRTKPEHMLEGLLLLFHAASILKDYYLENTDSTTSNKDKQISISMLEKSLTTGFSTTRNFVSYFLTTSDLIKTGRILKKGFIVELDQRSSQEKLFECYSVFSTGDKSRSYFLFEPYLAFISDLMKGIMVYTERKPSTQTFHATDSKWPSDQVFETLRLKTNEDLELFLNSGGNETHMIDFYERCQQNSSSKDSLLKMMSADIYQWSLDWVNSRRSLTSIYTIKFLQATNSYFNYFFTSGKTKSNKKLRVNVANIKNLNPSVFNSWMIDDLYEFCLLLEDAINQYPSEETATLALSSRFPQMYHSFIDEEGFEDFTSYIASLLPNNQPLSLKVDELSLRGLLGRHIWDQAIVKNVFNKHKLIYDIREVVSNELTPATVGKLTQELTYNTFDFESFFQKLEKLEEQTDQTFMPLPERILSWFFDGITLENMLETSQELFNFSDYATFMERILILSGLRGTSVINKISGNVPAYANDLWHKERTAQALRLDQIKEHLHRASLERLAAELPQENVETNPFWKGSFHQRCTRYLIAAFFIQEMRIIDSPTESSKYSVENPPDFHTDIVPWAEAKRKEHHSPTYTEFFYSFPMFRVHLDEPYREDLYHRASRAVNEANHD